MSPFLPCGTKRTKEKGVTMSLKENLILNRNSPSFKDGTSTMQENESILLSQTIMDACRRQSNIVVGTDIAEQPIGTNIFLGVGLITNNRISDGLGFGFIPMACIARAIQGDLIQKGIDSSIVVLVADQHGLNEKSDLLSSEQINFAANAVQHSCDKLFEFIGSTKTLVIKASNPNWPVVKSSYTEMETEDIIHAHEILDCGVKIGWQTKRKPKDGRVIRDEKWFDDQAKESLRLQHMSFVRTGEWMSIVTRIDPKTLPKKSKTVNTCPHNLPLPPYFGELDFHLGNLMNILEEIQKRNISQVMTAHLAVFDSVLKRVLGIREKTGRFEILQDLINTCAL
jgi:hypothetical protein